MRHLAWLNGSPKPPPGSKRAQRAEQEQIPSRIDQLKRRKIDPPMPPNPAPHIINRLVEIGLTQPAGMGAAPISWQEINEYQAATGIRLSSFEARLLRRLSVDYLASSRVADDETCPPPWKAPLTDRERDTEVMQLRLLLG